LSNRVLAPLKKYVPMTVRDQKFLEMQDFNFFQPNKFYTNLIQILFNLSKFTKFYPYFTKLVQIGINFAKIFLWDAAAF